MRRFSNSAGPGDPGVVVEPPPPGVASGRWTVSKTTLSIAGALVVLIGTVYFVIRALAAKKQGHR